MIRPITTVEVTPKLPPRLSRLVELAYNLRWSWDHDTINLFRRMDRELWDLTEHNPVLLLGTIQQEKLQAAAEDDAFLAHFDRVCKDFDHYMTTKNTWYRKQYGDFEQPFIGYFSAEFGLTESVRNYSGGLGILSGDHLKSASDLDIPLVGVGILYQEGYFQQYLGADGFQLEEYPTNDYSNLPVTRMTDSEGNPLKIKVPMPGREMTAQVWKLQAGRIQLFLLDSNLPENISEDRDLTDRLYGGDRRTRIRQEILIGIGGLRALEALNLRPVVCHMNEGHSAFLSLERIMTLMREQQVSFEEALHISNAGNVFTTHTPVPAGLERFGFDLIDEHFTPMFRQLGLSREQFIDLGRENMGGYELFSMPVLALKMSSAANGVAKLHGEVSRKMWQWMFPRLPVQEVPIGSVTNGIHVGTWVSQEMAVLFDRYLDPTWRENPDNPDIWKNVERIPDAELWRSHERRRERLVAFARRRLRQQLVRRGVSQAEISAADQVLNPDALTIGFARRFATYKRATLLFRDVDRLIELLNDPDRPVQIIFAGKAHPHDIPGKEMIKSIITMARRPELRDKIVFLENYDMAIARYLVQGVDVWLNTPRRPKEASGTSGMKVIFNGGLNASILDGWWAEGYDHTLGWAIGSGEEYPEAEWEMQDKIESQGLYDLLGRDLIPTFYERSSDGLPGAWIAKMKQSMQILSPYFNTHRMLREYTEKYYVPAYGRYQRLTEPDLSQGHQYLEWWQHIKREWGKINIKRVEASSEALKVSEDLQVKAWVNLGSLKPEEVKVQLYFGRLDTQGYIQNGQAVDMEVTNQWDDGTYEYTGSTAYLDSGERGISVRVLPHHETLDGIHQTGMVHWANE
ncbi:MAG: alpha-glucan family phosphorylase [Anaerolineae bacterium]|nr:alpha-glucan family phosphorylase [Anaerolineae bacterium]